MPARLAASALHVPHSRIRELAEIAMRMDGVLKLYFGESNRAHAGVHQARRARRRMAEGYTYYTEKPGYPSLRKALAAYYRSCTAWNWIRRRRSWSRRRACRR